MKRRITLRRVVLLLAGCVLGALIMLRLLQSYLVYFPTRTVDEQPSSLGHPFEDVFIPVAAAEKIHAWYFPLRSGQLQKSDRVILVSHGNGGNISDRLDLAGVLLDAGASVLLYDYEGYGQSTGKPGEEETYRDAQAAWHWLNQKGFAGTNIIAYGESLGGGPATELARRETVGGLILQSTFTSLTDVGAEVYPWLPVRLVASIHYNTLSKLPSIHVPVLILHSRQDRLIAFHHAERNFAAANAPKYFCEIEGDHNEGVFVSRAKILQAVKDFLHNLSNKAAH